MDNNDTTQKECLDENLASPPQDVQKKPSKLGAILLVGLMCIFMAAIFVFSQDRDNNTETNDETSSAESSVHRAPVHLSLNDFKQNTHDKDAKNTSRYDADRADSVYQTSIDDERRHDEAVKAAELKRQQDEAYQKMIITRMKAPGTLFENMSDSSDVFTIEANAKRILHPDSTLVQGEIIPAVLESAITSELAGQVRAVVSQPIYAYEGDSVLVPKGSRLFGTYQQALSQGQSRVAIIWHRVTLPNGIVANIESQSTDSLGRTGQGANYVDHHFFERFGQAMLTSLLSAGAATWNIGNNDEYNAKQAYRAGVSESLSDTAGEMLTENLNIKPTLYVNQGARLNILVEKDIDFHDVLRRTRG